MPNVRHSKHDIFAPGFVANILQHALGTANHPAVYGIVGLQGSGKSTLAAQMATLGKSHDLNVVVLAIDDFYYGKRERNALARNIHPLLAMRGPPGTHDVSLACKVLDKLRHGKPVRIPRFDKISDTRLPPSRWPLMNTRVDLIILEGWFLFAVPESKSSLIKPINSFESQQDKEGAWRHYCNQALKDYAEIWQRIDRSLFLQGPGFEQVKQWRWQQEQSLQAANPHRRAMTKKEVADFILLFERTSRSVFPQLPNKVDRVIRLDKNHKPAMQLFAEGALVPTLCSNRD
jgi:D-glycerate 3-kinase